MNKRIVLPEGNEPRTVVAAAICAKRGLARPVLLGEEAEIQRVAAQQGVSLGEGVEILSPSAIRGQYVEGLVALRGHKGVTDVVANELLQDNVTLGTMMLQHDDVDGLVSGAVNTTANTIRPALQLIKTAENASLVSSVFLCYYQTKFWFTATAPSTPILMHSSWPILQYNLLHRQRCSASSHGWP